jgi:hypothetical protein
VPCPAKTLPLIGADHLMHIWEYPHHADAIAYEAWEQRTRKLAKFIEWFRFLARRNFPEPETSLSRSLTTPVVELPAVPERQIYIFAKIPKKVGDQLEQDYGNRSVVPEGYGLLFEESFKVHRMLFLILIVYFLGSLGYLTWVFAEYCINSFPFLLAERY